MIRAIDVAIVFALGVGSTFALAQPQQPDPAALQKAIIALQQQRNAAMDQAASFQVQAAQLAEENEKLKKQIEEMKKAPQ